MKIFKSVLPLLIISIFTLYARQYYLQLPDSIMNALQYLPVLLIVFVSAVSLHFNQRRIFLYLIILSILYFILKYQVLDNSLSYNLFATLTPAVLFLTMYVKQQGVFTIRALPLYLLFVFTFLFSLWTIREVPTWAIYYLSNQWLPIQYFDWTQISQTSLAVLVSVFIGIIALLSIRQDHLTATGFGVFFIVLIGLQYLPNDQDLILLTISGLLLCLVNVLQESWRMAYLDELTQLPGRRAMREKLQSLVGLYTLVMVDIDFFKKFNDNYGHETGDDALRMIAAKLQKVTGGGLVYRYGGEEFTIVFTNKSVDQVKNYLETLRADIASSPFVVNRRTRNGKRLKDKSVEITVSIGTADSIGISTAEETLKKADKALYRAKKKGRNCIMD